MNTWDNVWVKANNVKNTENGDLAYKSTLNNHLDIFSSVNKTRKDLVINNYSDNVEKFIDAYSRDSKLALLLLFYLRDIRGGQGEKKIFYTLFYKLVKHDIKTASKLIPLIPEYGSWKDIVVLLGLSDKDDSLFRKVALNIIELQLLRDIENLKNNKSISLLAKWLPGVKTKDKNIRPALNLIVQKVFSGDIAKYRKTISKLRKSYNLFETNMTNGTYKNVDYSKVPSRSLYKHQKAIFDNDGRRYKEFLYKVNKGSVKLNAATLTPDLITSKVLSRDVNRDYLNLAWKNLSKLKDGVNKANILPMIDVSGSMEGKPMDVAIGLGLFVSEQQQGVFSNKFLTFSKDPNFIDVSRFNNAYDKISYIAETEWGFDTNLDKAFNKIVDMAIKYNVPKEKMPQFLLIISDMQFNEACKNISASQRIKDKFVSSGYDVPTIIFWNVADRYSTYPVEKDDNGTILISGENPSIMNLIMDGDVNGIANITPESIMLKALSNERYKPILDILGV